MIGDILAVGVGSFVIGAAFGYFYCRKLLWTIAEQVGISSYHHAQLFGYPYQRPTIAELESLLKDEKK